MGALRGYRASDRERGGREAAPLATTASADTANEHRLAQNWDEKYTTRHPKKKAPENAGEKEPKTSTERAEGRGRAHKSTKHEEEIEKSKMTRQKNSRLLLVRAILLEVAGSAARREEARNDTFIAGSRALWKCVLDLPFEQEVAVTAKAERAFRSLTDDATSLVAGSGSSDAVVRGLRLGLLHALVFGVGTRLRQLALGWFSGRWGRQLR